MNISELIIELHKLGSDLSMKNPEEGFEIRLLADKLARIGNKLYEKERINE